MKAGNAVDIDPGNQAQLEAWDGDEGAYWAEHAERFDRAIAAHHARLMAIAGIGTNERVVDIGCGSGQTTRDVRGAAGGGLALGVDLSREMLAYARKRAADEGVANATFEHADAQVHPFGAASFDVAIGRTSAMFFSDHAAAFTNIGRALVPSGRLALTVWQGPEGNEWIREISGALDAGRGMSGPPAGAGPFSLCEPDRVRDLLTASGFRDVEFEGTDAGMWFGSDAEDADGFILGLMGWMLVGLDDAGRSQAIEALHATTSAHATPDGVLFASAAWTISATRV